MRYDSTEQKWVNDSTVANKLYDIDNTTIIKNSVSNELEVPIDNNTIIVDSSDNKVKVSNNITTKLSKLNSDGTLNSDNVKFNQILGTVSGNTATFTDAKIGSSTSYLSEVYCSDSERYIKSQSVSGNTLTVTFDDSVAGTTCVLQLFKKGV